ncbi:hypothetical protein [Albidovulum sp.]|uniref:hypothetical protein n=1 Tax=Albidovulum sp. TaxID=1872424 RepID=UPI00352965C4
MAKEPHPVPSAIVMSAGTGGTSSDARPLSALSRVRYRTGRGPRELGLYDSYQSGDRSLTRACSSRIEGIGRPRVEPSFQHDVIDRMFQVPDAASVATILWLDAQIGRKAGASTGTNLWGAIRVAREMAAAGREGSIVTLMCDSGRRYLDTYYDAEWVARHIGETAPFLDDLAPLATRVA